MAICCGKGAEALLKGRKLFEEGENHKLSYKSIFISNSILFKYAKENVTEVSAVINLYLHLPETCLVVVGGLVCSSSLVLSF